MRKYFLNSQVCFIAALVSSDKAIVAARKLLLKGIQDVKEGNDPLHVVRDPSANNFLHIAVISEVAPKSADIRSIVQEKIAEQSRGDRPVARSVPSS